MASGGPFALVIDDGLLTEPRDLSSVFSPREHAQGGGQTAGSTGGQTAGDAGTVADVVHVIPHLGRGAAMADLAGDPAAALGTLSRAEMVPIRPDPHNVLSPSDRLIGALEQR
jgi:hypothetical protein